MMRVGTFLEASDGLVLLDVNQTPPLGHELRLRGGRCYGRTGT